MGCSIGGGSFTLPNHTHTSAALDGGALARASTLIDASAISAAVVSELSFGPAVSSQNVASSTLYFPIGLNDSNTTEANQQLPMPKCIVVALRCYVQFGASGGTPVCKLRKNGVDTGISISTTSTGFKKATGSVSFNEGDLLSIGVLNGSTTGGVVSALGVDVEFVV